MCQEMDCREPGHDDRYGRTKEEGVEGVTQVSGLSGHCTLYQDAGGDDQLGLSVVIVIDVEGAGGRGRLPYVGFLRGLRALDEDFAEFVSIRGEGSGQHGFAPPFDGFLVDRRRDDAAGLGKVRLLFARIPGAQEGPEGRLCL